MSERCHPGCEELAEITVSHAQGMSTSAFSEAYRKGRRTSSRNMLLIASQNNVGHCRLGLSVGKKIGPAVTRNLIKRRLRHIYRECLKDRPDLCLDIVLIVRSTEKNRTFSGIKQEFVHVLKRAGIFE